MQIWHIAIIVDLAIISWKAKEHNLPSALGHLKGVVTLKGNPQEVYDGLIGRYLTVYAFYRSWDRAGRVEIFFE